MTQDERLVYLLEYLIRENADYEGLSLPDEIDKRRTMLRALMNVRLPTPISEDFLKIQGEYLQEEQRKTTIIDANLLPSVSWDKRICLWQGDITTLKIDAIVNPANSGMCGCFCALHNCLDNIIHTKSGIELRLYCAEMMKKQGHEEAVGQAKITPGFHLPCQYILHTVGPCVAGRVRREDERLLASCYESCMKLADANRIRSLAFCCISTGVFHFPNEKAAEIAIGTVKRYLQQNTGIERVVFNVYKDCDRRIYESLLETA